MRFNLICDDDASTDSFSDLTLSQAINEITDHLAMGYRIDARPIFETAETYPPEAEE